MPVEEILQKAADSLNKNGFFARVLSRPEAVEHCLAQVTESDAVGLGGSATLRELALDELLDKKAKTVYNHWLPNLSPQQVAEVRKAQLTCDIFFTSSNAIAATGEIVNREGFGNRTNALTFGPKKAIVVVGRNKIAPDLSSAIKMIETKAAPARAKSLGMKTPCVKTGECSDCKSDDRICRITSIIHRIPLGSSIDVLIVDEQLGC